MNRKRKTRHGLCSEKTCAVGTSQNSSGKSALSPDARRSQLSGSLTLEAAFSLPLFMMICAAIISFMVILGLQTDIQVQLEETSRLMGRMAYMLETASSGNVNTTDGNGHSLDQQEISLINAGINSTVMKMVMLTGSNLSGKINRSRIVGGAGGLYTHESYFDETAGILDIITNYDYDVPWIPDSFGRLRLVQRMRSHAWTGRSLKEGIDGKNGTNSDASGKEKHVVYVTPTGSVYHTDPSCHYLDLSIHTVSGESVSSERNADGSRYERCSHCAGSGEYETVYITDYGTNWHASLSCSGLKRTVIEKDMSEVDNMRMCSKCAEHLHEHD